MRNFCLALCMAVVLALGINGQKIEKPTLTPTECTPEQKQLIREGVKLHDVKRYDGAVEKYQQVLTANPGCTVAMYELSLTYEAMGEKEKSLEIAYKGSKYKSEDLPLFYLSIANRIDDAGKPDEAVKIYRDAIKIIDGNKAMISHLASLYFNLGVTLTRQQKYAEAREEFKRAVEANPKYASPHLLLSSIYNGTKYKVPALLAGVRFISLEYNTGRTKTAASIVRDVLKPAGKNEKTGNIQIFLDLNAPKDEGDFGMYELLLGTMTTVRGDEDKDKSDEQIFVEAVGTILSMVSTDKKLGSTFVGKEYAPFAGELKKRGLSDVVGYLVLHHSGNPKGTEWLENNQTKFKEFLSFSSSFVRPK